MHHQTMDSSVNKVGFINFSPTLYKINVVVCVCYQHQDVQYFRGIIQQIQFSVMTIIILYFIFILSISDYIVIIIILKLML